MIKKIWNVLDKTIFTVMTLLFSVMEKSYDNSSHEAVLQFIKFGFVGVSNAGVYYIIYVSGLLVFRSNQLFPVWDYQVAQLIAFIGSVFWAFCLNRKCVFKESQEKFWVALVKFYVTYAFTGLFMNSILLYCWKSVGVSEYIGPMINVFFTTPINFLVNKRWSFKKGLSSEM